MTPVSFPEANCNFKAPPDLEESQCMTIPAYKGIIERGSVEGAPIVVVAWKPSIEELEILKRGGPIFLSMLGGLPPHFLTTQFEEAIRPA